MLFVGLPFIALSIWIIKVVIEKNREKKIKKEIEIFKAIHRRELEGLDELEIYTIYMFYKNDREINEISKNNGIKHKNQKEIMKTKILLSTLILLFSFSCVKRQNSVANYTNIESILLPETPSSEESVKEMEDDLDRIIRRKNEDYRVQIKNSPYHEEFIAIDSERIEKNFSELLENFMYSEYYKTKQTPSSAKERALKKAFEKTFNSFIKELRKEYEESEMFEFNSSFHIIGDINGDTVNDGYVRFDYGEGLLANAHVGNAFFIYKDGNFEFLQSFEERGYGWSEESPDNIIGVKNKLIYATSHEYLESDARCCPSIEIKKVFKLINNKIVEIYRIYSEEVYSSD